MSGYEWRACVRDNGDVVGDYEGPFDSREEAEDVLAGLLTVTDPPYDEAWIERRAQSEWERVAAAFENRRSK